MTASCFVSSEPLPVRTAHISDYKESPETGVVFEIEPPAGNVFSRVNISYTEGHEHRAMLYKGMKEAPDPSFRPLTVVTITERRRCVGRFLRGEDGVQALVTGDVLPQHHLPADL